MNESTETSREGQDRIAPAEQDATDVSDEAIAKRAYEISVSEDAGTPEENWARAERELRGS